MSFIQLPPDLLEKYKESDAKGYGLWAVRQFLAAAKLFNDLYQLLKEKQPKEGRYHKGGPLYNQGLSWIHAGEPAKGLQPILLAYIEDCLSDGPRDPRIESYAATKIQREYYGFSEEGFETLRRSIERQGDPDQVKEPERVYEAYLRALGKPDEEVALELQKLNDRRRNYQKFDKDWEHRVFIGGAYRDPSKLEFLRGIVTDLNFEPIIASDFLTLPEWTRHHALMLLHSCKYAIFDVAIEAGQLIEIDRCLDYQVKALALCPANDPEEEARISDMIKSHPIEKSPYRTLEEMRHKVVRFLTCTT